MVELTATEAAFIGVGFTLVGALISALATLVAARLAAERQQLYVESTKFRSAFVEEILRLRSAHDDAYRILSADVMAKHRRATVLFEPWVARRDIRDFHTAWATYESTINTTAPGSIDNRNRECAEALARIERLLSFATHRG